MTDRLINLTPHSVHLLGQDDRLLAELPVAGPPARCAERTEPTGRIEVDGVAVPVVRLGHGEVTDLPDRAPGVWYVVSRVVADASPERDDLLVPTDIVRDAEGRPLGCRALARGATIRGPR